MASIHRQKQIRETHPPVDRTLPLETALWKLCFGLHDETYLILKKRKSTPKLLTSRRAIESRIEERRLRSDLDYLESDDDNTEDDDLDS